MTVSLMLACVTARAELVVSGRVISETGVPVAAAIVDAGSQHYETDSGGRFRFVLDGYDPVSLQVSADGFYDSIHTWHRSDFDAGEARIPDIELVERKRGRKLLLFAGDAMLSRRFFEPWAGEPVLVRRGHEEEDSKKLLATIRPYVELADYASVNVETQMSADTLTDRLPKSFTFYSPPALAKALRWAGFDYAALGNNHTWDYQEQGLVPTLAALDAAGFDYSGAGLDEASARKAQSVEIGDRAYRFLSYVGWAGLFSPSQTASGDKGGAALGSSDVFEEDLAPMEPSTVAVLQYHSGLEYSEAPAISERMRLREAIDYGADIAIAHHPHVLQGLEIYRDRLIAYSMGNFLFDQFDYSTQLAMLLYVWMDGDRLHRAEVVPVNINSYVPTPAIGQFRDAIVHRLARISRPLGTCLRANGAHAVVEKCAASPAEEASVVDIGPADPATVPIAIRAMGVAPFNPVVCVAPGHQYRLGTNLLARGDFESQDLFGTHGRAWIRDQNSDISVADGRVLRVEVLRGEKVRTGMKMFERTYTVSNPTTFSGRIRSTGDATVDVLLQRQRKDDSLDDGLRIGPSKIVGRVHVKAGDWQSFSLDFDQPRVSTRAVRLLFDVQGAERDVSVWFDDLAWTEWRTPWLDAAAPGNTAEYASHVQFRPRP